jgi:hypothetical protein
MGTITDDTLPSVRQLLEADRQMLAVHLQGCEPCRTTAPSKASWCPDGWLMRKSQGELLGMIRRMEAIQAEQRQPQLFDGVDDPGSGGAA